MKLIGNTIYIEFKEMVDAGLSVAVLHNAKWRQSPSWSFINDTSDKRKVLIEYDRLKTNYKEMIVAKYGEPATYLSAQILKPLLQDNPTDIHFLSKYRLPNGNAIATAALA